MKTADALEVVRRMLNSAEGERAIKTFHIGTLAKQLSEIASDKQIADDNAFEAVIEAQAAIDAMPREWGSF